MTNTEQDLHDKLATAWRLPYGRAQIAAVEEVIRHADAQELTDLQYQARVMATTAYYYGAEPAKSFVTFAWCLAVYDRGEADPQFDHNLYWYFKWMVSAMTRFPDVPLDQTYAVLDDMERRYRVAGHPLNPVHQHRELVARHLGDADTAAEQYRLWCAAPRGEMSDCVGCEPTSKVEHLSWLHRDEDAVALAGPVLDGSLDCSEQPHAILSTLLVPYLRTGRLTEAADAHRRAYRAIQGNRNQLSLVADHLLFCALSGNHARGLDLVERHLGWLDEPPTPHADMWFAATAALVLRQVADTGHGDVPVRRQAFGDRQEAEISVSALRADLTARAVALAARFDRRNGTATVGDEIAETLAAQPIVEHLPLSGPARRPAPEPAPVALPESAAELVELARSESRLGNIAAAAAAWQRFDEVCAEPEPEQLAHRLFARGIELVGQDPERAEQDLTRAAELFGQAGRPVRQLGARSHLGLLWCVLGRAEDGTAEVAANTEQVMAVGDDEEKSAAQVRLGIVCQLTDRTDDALAAFASAASLGEQAGRADLVADAAARTAQSYAALGGEHWPNALEHVDRAVAGYLPLGPSGNLRQAQLLAGRLHAAAGHLDQAYELLGEAATAVDPAIQGPALHLRGQVAQDLDRAEDAYEHLASAVAVLGGADPYAKVDLGAACLQVGRADEAADALEEAAPDLTRAGDENAANRAKFLLARAYRTLEQHDQALALLEHVAASCVAAGNQAGAGQMHAMAGEILDQLDRDDQAAMRYTQAATAFHDAELPLEEMANARSAAVSWRWAFETEQCLTALSAADDVAATVDSDEPAAVWQKAMLAYDGARILADLEQPADALDRVVTAIDGFRSLDATTEATVATVLHGRLLVDLDRGTEAEPLLEAALKELPEEAAGPRQEVESLLTTIRPR